jgi:hypothetical protein
MLDVLVAAVEELRHARLDFQLASGWCINI